MTPRAGTLLAVMTVAMLLLAGASFWAAGDRALAAILIAFGAVRGAFAIRDAYRGSRNTDDT